jgi:prepilin-type N-terminal cleavage/methylation domain-containing protein
MERAETRRGFTLIELLVVIAIIGLLASVVMASLNSARAKARDAKRVSELKQISLAIEFYYDANGSYPAGYGTYYWISDNNYPGTSWPPCDPVRGLAPWLPNVCSLKDSNGSPYAYSGKSDGSPKLGAAFETAPYRGTPYTYGPGNTPVSGWYQWP